MQTLRTKMISNDPYRNWTLLWGHDCLQPISINGQSCVNAYYSRQEAAKTVMTWLFMPPNIPIYAGKLVDNINITITVKLPQKLITIAAGASDREVELRLRQGYKVTLAPGYHQWSSAINLQGINNAFLEGFGAIVERIPNGDYGDRMFVGGSNFTCRGITFIPTNIVFHADPVMTGLVCGRCKFLNGLIGWGHEEAHFINCIFDGCGASPAILGLYQNCRFINNNSGNAFNIFGPADGKVALVDVDFNGTDRGPGYNTANGPVLNNIAHNIICTNGVRDQNGSEIFNAEGKYEVSNNIHTHIRAFNWFGTVAEMFDCPAKNNLFYDVITDGCNVFGLFGAGTVEQSGNSLDHFEVRNSPGIKFGWQDGSGKILGEFIKNNTIQNGSIVGYTPTRLNQYDFGPQYYQRPVGMIADLFGPDRNNIKNVCFVDIPIDIKTNYNFSEENCQRIP